MPCYQILTVTRCVTLLLVNFQFIEYYTVLRLITNCYNHQDEQDPNNPNPPVRRNPRIANSKIFDESQGGTNKQLVIMNDPGLLSLINESLPRTPMDLIQVRIYIDTARPCPIPPLHPVLASISPSRPTSPLPPRQCTPIASSTGWIAWRVTCLTTGI